MSDAREPDPIRFGGAEAPLFGWYHPPAEDARRAAAVVLCSPVGLEQALSYRAYRALADRLSREGFGVVRFDWRGTGNSAPHSTGEIVAAWLRDVHSAANEARARSGARDVALVGLRLGATLAVGFRGEGLASVVLWSPCLSGAAYLREARVAGLFAASEDAGEVTHGAWRDEDRASLLQLDLLSAATAMPARRALVIGSGQLPVEKAPVSRLREVGVETAYLHLPGTSCLTAGSSDAAEPAVLAIVDWLSRAHVRSLAARIAPRPTASRLEGTTADDAFRETPLLFGVERESFGIVTEPAADRAKPDAPTLLLLNPSVLDPDRARDVGAHELCVALARRCAELGFASFRFDLAGGARRSPGADRAREAEIAVRGAMTALAASRPARFVAVGFCLGATLAFRVATKHVLSGLVMVNPGFFYPEDGGAEGDALRDGARLHHYRRLLLERETWRKAARGGVDLGRFARAMAGLVARRAKSVMRFSAPGERGARPRRDLGADLRSMMDRGTETLLVYTEHDLGLTYVERTFGRQIGALRPLPRFRMEVLAGDHAFVGASAQERLMALLLDHLVQRHGSDAG